MPSLIRDRAASTPDMIAVFGDEALVRAALAFEAALARASAGEGLISANDAEAIIQACSALPDLCALAEEAAHAGTLAIPLVQWLRQETTKRAQASAGAVHLGATSQDVADTALMLQAKAGAMLIERDLVRLADGLAALAKTHAATPMIGRTLLQQARPITFGLKAAHWMLSIDAAAVRFRREREGALNLQFGGAAGTQADLAGKGEAIAGRMAAELGLTCPAMPWHARRDGVAGLATALAIIVGAVGKVALDVALMAQSEVGEAFEPLAEGRGGSSAMPHKRNPTGCQIALSAAQRAPGLAAIVLAGMPQAHERGLGGWQAEGPVLAELFQITHGAVAAMADVIADLDIDTGAMRRNLDAAEVGEDVGQSLALVQRALAGRETR